MNLIFQKCVWDEERKGRLLLFFVLKSQSPACFQEQGSSSTGLCPKAKPHCFKNLPNDSAAKPKELQVLVLPVSSSIWKHYCQHQRTHGSSYSLGIGSCHPPLILFIAPSCVPQNPPSSASFPCGIHSLSPTPEQKLNSPPEFCRLDVRLCNPASLHWLKIIKGIGKKKAYFRPKCCAILMQCSGCGRIAWFPPQSLKWSWGCCINRPWMSSLILFVAILSPFSPKPDPSHLLGCCVPCSSPAVQPVNQWLLSQGIRIPRSGK